MVYFVFLLMRERVDRITPFSPFSTSELLLEVLPSIPEIVYGVQAQSSATENRTHREPVKMTKQRPQLSN